MSGMLGSMDILFSSFGFSMYLIICFNSESVRCSCLISSVDQRLGSSVSSVSGVFVLMDMIVLLKSVTM